MIEQQKQLDKITSLKDKIDDALNKNPTINFKEVFTQQNIQKLLQQNNMQRDTPQEPIVPAKKQLIDLQSDEDTHPPATQQKLKQGGIYKIINSLDIIMEEGDDLASSMRFSGTLPPKTPSKLRPVENDAFFQRITEQGKDSQLYIYYNDQMVVVDNEHQQNQILAVLNQKQAEVVQIQCRQMEAHHKVLANLLDQMDAHRITNRLPQDHPEPTQHDLDHEMHQVYQIFHSINQLAHKNQ